MKLRQFTIRTLLLVVTAVAIFCAGYLVGFDNGRNARFEDLFNLIQETIAPGSEWVSNELSLAKPVAKVQSFTDPLD